MNKNIIVLALLSFVLNGLNPVLSKHGQDKVKSELTKSKRHQAKDSMPKGHSHQQNEDSDSNDDDGDNDNDRSHPVFGTGKLHPVHDDKVIGKFKNKEKIKEKVQIVDQLVTKREELLKTRTNIEQSSPQLAIIGDLLKKYNLTMNDLQLKQNKQELTKVTDDLTSTDKEESEAKNLIKSYVSSLLTEKIQ